tara:strand:+ start:6623 stop:6925 length:303 start_codon:yes stop_codon:yes gene_type:complete
MSIIKPGTGSKAQPVKGWMYNIYRAMNSNGVYDEVYPVWCCGYALFTREPPKTDAFYGGGSQWRGGVVYETEAEARAELLADCDAWWAERRAKLVKGAKP